MKLLGKKHSNIPGSWAAHQSNTINHICLFVCRFWKVVLKEYKHHLGVLKFVKNVIRERKRQLLIMIYCPFVFCLFVVYKAFPMIQGSFTCCLRWNNLSHALFSILIPEWLLIAVFGFGICLFDFFNWELIKINSKL